MGFSQRDNTDRLSEIFEARVGTVISSYIGDPDNASDKRLFCDVDVHPRGLRSKVAFYGGGVDIETENGMPHGIIFPPRKGQYVLVLFINGDWQSPAVCVPFAHPSDQTFTEKYYDLLEDIDDSAIYHHSGTKIVMKKDGTVIIGKKIDESTKHEVTLSFTSDGIKLESEDKIGLQGFDKKVSRVDDAIEINNATDAPLFLWWTTFMAGLTTFLTALNPGSLTAQAAAFLTIISTNPPPGTYKGKITEGNDKVRSS